jgi:hypothetical protein
MSAEITVISFFLATLLLPLEPWSLLPWSLVSTDSVSIPPDKYESLRQPVILLSYNYQAKSGIYVIQFDLLSGRILLYQHLKPLCCQSGSVLHLAERWNDAVKELDGTCFSLSKRLGSSQSAISNERAASVFPLN